MNYFKEQTTGLQDAFRILLGLGLFFAGVGHLTFARVSFQAQVPNWVPMEKDLVVLLSGIVGILLAFTVLVVRKYRSKIGIGLAIFFVMVFPGNIAQYLNRYDAFGLDTDSSRLLRLFFQPVLIFWAIWSTGAWSLVRQKNSSHEIVNC